MVLGQTLSTSGLIMGGVTRDEMDMTRNGYGRHMAGALYGAWALPA